MYGKVQYVPILTPTNLAWNLNWDPVWLTGSLAYEQRALPSNTEHEPWTLTGAWRMGETRV